MLKYAILFLLVFSNCFAYQYDLSICTIFRDEASYLKEWIEYHRMLGAQHFYLCNHASKDNYLEVLQPYIDAGIVELKDRQDSNPDQGLHYFLNNFQNAFFNEIITKTRGVSKWVAFIDSDEFLVTVEKDSLIDFLKDYESFGGVVANWQMFGTSRISNINSNELMIEKLIHCAQVDHPCNYHVKSILQPDRAIGFGCPHFAIYIDGFYQVNTDKIFFGGPFSPYVQIDKLFINHYWTRDEDYLNHIKIPRQISFGNSPDVTRNSNIQFNKIQDLTIQRFVPDLRKRMGLD